MAKLAPYLKLSTWLCIREDGPLWFRGYDEFRTRQGIPPVEKILSRPTTPQTLWWAIRCRRWRTFAHGLVAEFS